MGGLQQLSCVCDIIQAADERPETFSEEKVETSGSRRGATHQKYDGKALGNYLCSQKVLDVFKLSLLNYIRRIFSHNITDLFL